MRRMWILVLATVGLMVIGGGAYLLLLPPSFEVVFCDVGQGDATLIRTPGRHDILIDGGPNAAVLDCLGRHLPPFDHTLEMVVATHPDNDHVAGLALVAQRYTIARLVVSGKEDDLPAYQALLSTVAASGGEIVLATSGQQWQFGEVIGTVLWPPPDFAVAAKENNSTSVTLRFTSGPASVLLTGDLPAAQERQIIASQAELASSLLKAGHHGSATSSAPGWLDAVHPQAVIVSAGKNNRYHHPALVVLERLAQAQVPVYRTDQQGDIVWRQRHGQLVPCQQWWCVVW